jgi:hypothetical protein
MRKKLKIAKWIVGLIVIIALSIGIISKIIQLVYLGSINWNMVSFSIWYVALIFIGSLAFVSLSLIEHSLKGVKIRKDPEHIVILVLGFVGLVYSLFLFVIKIIGWLR